MFKKLFLSHIFILSILSYNPVYSSQYGLFIESYDIIEENNQRFIEKSEAQLSLKMLQFNFERNIFEDTPFNRKNIIFIDDEKRQSEEIFEFIGMFISNYKSTNNLKIKLKFTKDAELDKGSIVWKVRF